MNTKFKLITLIACFSIVTGCVFHVGGKGHHGKTADVTIDKTLELDATSLTQLSIEAGAGSLNVIGSETNVITVIAKIRTDEAKDYTLTLEKSGTQAQLIAEQKSFGYWSGTSPYIDLTITIPKSLSLDIDDGSGNISISRINNDIILEDGSGSIEITKINGHIQLTDGSGSIYIENINGNINLDDGSGSLTIKNTTGNIDIEDGSGGMSVHNTSGKVTIDDGSGDIEVEHAGGLKIIEAGSGGLKLSNISGEMDIDA